jgi:hypothetical protein
MVCKTVRGGMRKALTDDGRRNRFFREEEDDGSDE